MSITNGNYALPVEISEIVLSHLMEYDDLDNALKVWPAVENGRLWRKYFKRKIQTRLWKKTLTFLGWNSSHSPDDFVKEICSEISTCCKYVQQNWITGQFLSRKFPLPNKGLVVNDLKVGKFRMNSVRIAVWLLYPQSKILIVKRHNLVKEKEICLSGKVHSMFLNEDSFLFVGCENIVKIWDLETAVQNGEICDQLATGLVRRITYHCGVLVSLSETSPNSAVTRLTVRHFSKEMEVIKTDYGPDLPFCTTDWDSFDFDGHYICVGGEQQVESSADDEDEYFDDSCYFDVEDDDSYYYIHVYSLDDLSRCWPIEFTMRNCVTSFRCSDGLLYAVSTSSFSIYDLESGELLRRVIQQMSTNSMESICVNSEFLVTSCRSYVSIIQCEIKIWKLSALLCPEEFTTPECLVFSIIIPPSVENLHLRCDSFQIVGTNEEGLLVCDFWRPIRDGNPF